MDKSEFDLSKLTAAEKLDLIDDIWCSLSPSDFGLSPELCAELDRRLYHIEEKGPIGVAWEDVLAEMTTDES
jgi:putative addiction module component (TIGR02574 family)